MLKGKKVVLGVTGGIAVYKAVEIVSRLVKLGADVQVVMTKHAAEFVTPLTFRSISSNPVVTHMFEEPKRWEIEHIGLSQWADVYLVAPATANIIGKVANGIGDDFLSTSLMATTAKVIFAPAMNTQMYLNKITQKNIESLKELGYLFLTPDSGRMACGDMGPGRLPSPESIVEYVTNLLCEELPLKGVKYLVTAGPTREPIDPVRFLTNRSTGKMGYSIAEAARDLGADVTLISGPTNLEIPKGVNFIPVETAQEMYNEVIAHLDNDIIIKTAAVSDYTPADYSDKKVKKSDDDLSIKLKRNKDILFEVGKLKKKQILVGFAAETNNVLEYAKGKIEKKNLDFIVANDVSKSGAGFGTNTNIVTIIDSDGTSENYDLMEKSEIAKIVVKKAFM
jgi:phosphopantothenoylcysteine decarboxylase/phosphopantothenate--cysteine ligase